VVGRREVVVVDTSTGRSYTPQDWPRLLADAGEPTLAEIAAHYIGFVRFTDPAHFPDVDVYAEKGSGIATVVGARVPSLTAGQVVNPDTDLITRDGDINQEDITNEAVAVWAGTRHHFSLTDNPGVNHFQLPSNPGVLQRSSLRQRHRAPADNAGVRRAPALSVDEPPPARSGRPPSATPARARSAPLRSRASGRY